MYLLGWVWNWEINSGSQWWSAVSYLWDSSAPCAAQIVRPGLAMRHYHNKEVSHVLGALMQLSSRRPRYFSSCIYQVHLHMECLAATCADFLWKNFPSVMFTCKKKPWRFHPHHWNGTSFCLLQLSARLLLKRQRGEEKMQTRFFLAFHIKSCSQQDHKCLRWQRERDSVSPWLLISTNNLLFICSTVRSISCFIQAY